MDSILTSAKKYLLFLLLFCSTPVFARELPSDSVSIYIARLNWKSFGMTSGYVSTPLLFHDAQRIMALKDRNKIKKLIATLPSCEKAVIVHMILTQLLEPKKTAFKLSYVYAKDGTVAIVHNTYNGITWDYDTKTEMSTISKKEFLAVQKYWQQSHK